MNAPALQQVQNNAINKYRNNPVALLKWIKKNLPNEKIVMGTGFGPPGIVLLDMLFKVTRIFLYFILIQVFCLIKHMSCATNFRIDTGLNS